VFCCLAKHLNKAVSRKELYGSLGKKDFDYEDSSLTLLIHRLRKKCPGQNEAIQIKSVRGIGYQLSGDFVVL
jgi:DNA-binding response OmpR family regulator